MSDPLKPPPSLDSCRVLAYAVLNDSVPYKGSNLYRADKEVGPVPCLAIVEWHAGVLLLHCDAEWNSLGGAGYDSVDEAKESAQRIYPGSDHLWLDPQYTQEDAAKHEEQLWSGMRCRFCGKIPPQLESERMIERNGVRICESCIRACAALLNEKETS